MLYIKIQKSSKECFKLTEIANELKINNSYKLTYSRTLMTRSIVEYKKWNGKGYSNGIKGTEIPMAARIMAIADAYDALTTERRYKKSYSHKHIVFVMRDESGD